MRVAVLDCEYKEDLGFYGASAAWLRWELARCGAEIVRAREAQVVLATYTSASDAHEVTLALKRAGVQPSKVRRSRSPWVFVGGGAASAPPVFDDVADAVCVGEGVRFVRTLVAHGPEAACQLPESWVAGETRPVEYNLDFPFDAPPVRCFDGHLRLYVSRGCRKTCLFCQTGWERQFTPHPDPARACRIAAALRAKGEKIQLASNDVAADGLLAEGITQGSLSYSALVSLSSLPQDHKLKSIRIGVEGISERLRAAVGKPIPAAGLVDVSAKMSARGADVKWFMVAGLPGETEADWEELRETVNMIRRAQPRRRVTLSFTAFNPMPAAPLCIAPLTDEYSDRMASLMSWFISGPGYTHHVAFLKCRGPKTRAEGAANTMACDESRLRRGWPDADPPAWRIRYRHPPEVRRKAWDVYRRKVGAL